MKFENVKTVFVTPPVSIEIIRDIWVELSRRIASVSASECDVLSKNERELYESLTIRLKHECVELGLVETESSNQPQS